MQESNFQFRNPILKRLNYKVNDDFDRDKFDKIKLNFRTHVVGRKSAKEAMVTLLGQIGEMEENSPFYIEVEIVSPFKWTDDISEEALNKLLKRNGSALLLSYMRPIVAFVTSQSGIAPYNIPYIDFTKEEEKEV